MLRVSALLSILIYCSSTLEESDLDSPYYDSYLEHFDLQESFPRGDCSVDGNVCVMQDNVVQIVSNVPTLDECRLLCFDEPDCKFLTHFNPDSFPFVETCAMFTSCDNMTTCTECTTEDRACIPCSAGVQGMLGNNFIQFIPDMPGEFECKEACEAHDNCTIYTYNRKSSDNIPGGCFLLSGIQEPVQKCEDCATGPFNCEDRCTFSVDGGEFTNTIDPININKTVKILAFGTCELTVMAVGGGASGSQGGGGSGYVTWKSDSGAGMREMQVTVGGKDEDTVVWLLDGNPDTDATVFLEAKSGERSSGDRIAWNGGDGYSGGGGGAGSDTMNGGDGGTDGGNGTDSSDGVGKGGSGSGVILDSISIDGFQLSGGAAGNHSSNFGGGGGGVLVNGAGPDQVSVEDGQGYGAGGSGNSGDGTLGIVLFSYRNDTSNQIN